MSDEKNLPVVHSAQNLTIIFPKKNEHISDKDAKKNRDLIKNEGAYTGNGKVYLNTRALTHILATDKKGVNRFYNNLENEDKLEQGEKNLVSVAALSKEISERIQEPRDNLQKERLRDSEKCLNALRDSPDLEKVREVAESKNRKEKYKLKQRKIAAENISTCQLTGKPLEADADAHHIARQADEPRETLNLDNIIVINKQPHREIHAAGAESSEELSELCKEKDWNDPTKS